MHRAEFNNKYIRKIMLLLSAVKDLWRFSRILSPYNSNGFLSKELLANGERVFFFVFSTKH